MKVVLIICNYNNEKEIEAVLKETLQVMQLEDVLVVDDGSTDNSPSIIQKYNVKTIRHLRNFGVGAAIRTGLYEAKKLGYDVAVMIASNGKMKPHQMNNLLNVIIDGYDFVQGSRYMDTSGGSPSLTTFRKLTIPILSFFISLLLRKRFTDITCGYRALKLSILDDKRINLNQDWLNRYELESYLIYKVCRLGYKVTQAPVMMDYSHLEKKRRSKIRPIIDWWSILKPFIMLRLGIRM